VTSRDPGAEILEVLRQATLGEYDVVGELGRGGMAIVYLAHDIALDRKVAIKVMHPSLLLGSGMNERFKREARIAASLTHPNIIPIHMVRETEKLSFFVMKYVEGRGLDSIISEIGALPIKMVQTILSQVGTALGYAHRRGVVHRDIKPANILIDSEGWVVVTDFGIAKAAEAGTLTASGTTVGTPSYMSPEQCSARPVTGASDQYSLGVVGYEMISGRPPFASDSLMEIMRMHFFEPVPALLRIRPDCPPPLAASIQRMLEKEPHHRWPSIEHAIRACGEEPLSRDDPIRGQLIRLARTGIKPVARFSTPMSPTPLQRSPLPHAVGHEADAKRAPVAEATPRDVGSRRRPMTSRKAITWGLVAVVTAGGAFGVYRLVRPAPGPGAGEHSPGTSPSAIAAIDIAGTPPALEIGQVVQLSASAKNQLGAIVDSAPVRWSSRDSTVARVSAAGLLTAVAAGSTAITATSGASAESVDVTVRAPAAPIAVAPAGPRVPSRPAIASLRVSPRSATLEIGDTATVSVFARDARGTLVAARSVNWGSSDRTIATVSTTGVVTGVAAGTATILAMTDGVKSDGAGITVVSPAPVAPGRLQALITPWAYITIDDRAHGARDRIDEQLAARVPHHLHLERQGYLAFDTTVVLKPGETARLTIQLPPRKP
jgi:serine/threonine-protein kinase